MKTERQLRAEGRSDAYIHGYLASTRTDAEKEGARAGYIWVNDPDVEGGGYWRRKGTKAKTKFWKGVGAGVAGTLGASLGLSVAGGALAVHQHNQLMKMERDKYRQMYGKDPNW